MNVCVKRRAEHPQSGLTHDEGVSVRFIPLKAGTL
jgi:hypothetical protein